MREGPSRSAYRSGLQTAIRRLWTKAMVVSAEGKGPARTGSGVRQEEDRKETTDEVSKAIRRCQNRGVVTIAGRALTVPVYGQSGIRHERWPELAMRRLGGTWEVCKRCKRKPISADHEGEISMRLQMADHPVVVM